jgi:hypothetical protein
MSFGERERRALLFQSWLSGKVKVYRTELQRHPPDTVVGYSSEAISE